MVAGPIGELADALRRVRRGDFKVRLPRRAGAAGEVADAFNDVVSLQERQNLDVRRISRIVGRDGRLAERPWMMGDDYSIADIAIFPWVRNLVGFYGAGDLVGIERYPNVTRSLSAFVARPAVQAGLLIPKADTP